MRSLLLSLLLTGCGSWTDYDCTCEGADVASQDEWWTTDECLNGASVSLREDNPDTPAANAAAICCAEPAEGDTEGEADCTCTCAED